MVRYRVKEVRVKPEIWWRLGREFVCVEDGMRRTKPEGKPMVGCSGVGDTNWVLDFGLEELREILDAFIGLSVGYR